MPILGFGVFQVTDLKECETSVLNASAFWRCLWFVARHAGIV